MFYRRIRNTARYLLSNLHDFDPGLDQIPLNKCLALDRYILHRAHQLQHDILKAYEHYDFHSICQHIHHFVVLNWEAFI